MGTVTFLPLMVWNKFTTYRGVFYTVVGLAVIAVAVELLCFETDVFGPRADEEPMAGD